MLIHYWLLIKELGLEEEWKGKVIELKLTRAGAKSKQFGNLFKNLNLKKIEKRGYENKTSI